MPQKPWAGNDIEILTEAFRRAALREFVRELLTYDNAQSILAWPHSGFHVHRHIAACAV